jgi:hypothetical protein
MGPIVTEPVSESPATRRGLDTGSLSGAGAAQIGGECGCGGGPFRADASIVRTMNSLLAHLLAATLADSAGELAGTPRGEQPTVAERALACGCDTAAGAR